ncbi:MAG: hypothetical protein V4525_08830 [Pseudomonadota bacterium]
MNAKKISLYCLAFIMPQMVTNTNAATYSSSPIHFYRAIYAMQVDQHMETTARQEMSIEKRSEAQLTRNVFIFGSKGIRDSSLPSISDALKSGKATLFGVARGAYFIGENEKPLPSSATAYYLLGHWEPCLARSVSQISVSSMTNNKNDKPTEQVSALWVKGCATHPSNYSSMILVGTGIQEVLSIQKAPPDESNRPFEPMQVAPGSPPTLVNMVRKMNEELARQDKARREKAESAPKVKPTPPPIDADNYMMKEIHQTNETLRQSGKPIQPVQPLHSRIYSNDSRVQPFVNAAAADSGFKGFEPTYFVSVGHQQFVLFTPSSSTANRGVTKLTQMSNGRLHIIEEGSLE